MFFSHSLFANSIYLILHFAFGQRSRTALKLAESGDGRGMWEAGFGGFLRVKNTSTGKPVDVFSLFLLLSRGMCRDGIVC